MAKCELGVYYWSNWHPSEENDLKRGKGWTEWEYLKQAIPRFAGHHQPKIPIWGYLDDSKTETLQMQIDTAADHGIDSFIFDYDWCKTADNAELLAFENAPNTNRLKFGLMFCCPDIPDDLEGFFSNVVHSHFSRPNYWRVNGGLYFSVYEFHKFVKKLGSVEAVAQKFNLFREMTRQAGLGEIHLVAVEWGLQKHNWEGLNGTPEELICALKIDAVTTYTWYHNTAPTWPTGLYRSWAEKAYGCMEELLSTLPVPYYPNVSVGWDPSPRCMPNMRYVEGGPLQYHTLSGEFELFAEPYFSGITKEDTPEELEWAARRVKAMAQKVNSPVITMNAWNEWTEGAFLEPDSQYGYGKLEAVRNVFKEE